VSDADGAIELYFNNSKKLHTYSNGINVTGRIAFTDASLTSVIDIPDGKQIAIGDSGDLSIYHDGTNSYLQNTTGFLIFNADAGNIDFRFNSNNDHAIDMNRDGGVELYYDNSLKLHTNSVGANVTGRLYVSSYIDCDSDYYVKDNKKIICWKW
jgi:hypothetical protein